MAKKSANSQGDVDAFISHGHLPTLWSLTASWHWHKLDPQRYLTSVLAKIHRTATADLAQFRPGVWNREAAAKTLPKT